MLHCKIKIPHCTMKADASVFESLRILSSGFLLVALFLHAKPCAAEEALPIAEVAPGNFVHQGVHEETTRDNHGAIANIGFAVGEKCVAVIDSGGSYENGLRLRNAIRSRTSLPICYVINTHVHPDHIYGNAAFRQDSPKFIGHHRLAASLAARQPYYAKALTRSLGEEAAQRAEPVVPDVPVKDALSVDLGGRTLELKAWPTAHTDTDLTVFDNKTGTLWAGDLLFEKRTPSLDGSLRGWLGVIEELQKVPAARVVPGHGKISMEWPAALEPQQQYLTALLNDVRKAIKENKTLQQAVDQAGRAQAGQWLLFDDYHPHNVTVAFTELEWED
jgi:quinoprotein relay system zinc metallohydrolase 2